MSDPITPLTPAQTAQQEQSAAHESYPHRVIEMVDATVGTLLGGPQDVTISSDLAVMDRKDTGIKHEIGKAGSAFLDLFQKDHGAKAVAADLERAQAVEREAQSSGIVSGQ